MDIENPTTAPIAEPATDTSTEGNTTRPDMWDWTDYGDRHVTVKVDGQEQYVPLKEALDG